MINKDICLKVIRDAMDDELSAWSSSDYRRAVRSALDDAYTRIETAVNARANEQHPDDAAVDRFAAAMKAKLAESRKKGRYGWNDPVICTVERLQALLAGHMTKGDPVDVANFAMMLFHRGAQTADPMTIRTWVDAAIEAVNLPCKERSTE